MAVITRDYTAQDTKALTPDEQLMELNEPKEKYLASLFKSDMELCRKLNLNLSRILRFKLHDWLQEKEFEVMTHGRRN